MKRPWWRANAAVAVMCPLRRAPLPVYGRTPLPLCALALLFHEHALPTRSRLLRFLRCLDALRQRMRNRWRDPEAWHAIRTQESALEVVLANDANCTIVGIIADSGVRIGEVSQGRGIRRRSLLAAMTLPNDSTNLSNKFVILGIYISGHRSPTRLSRCQPSGRLSHWLPPVVLQSMLLPTWRNLRSKTRTSDLLCPS